MAAAVGVIAEYGLGQASIEQMCAAAGFTRGAFYSNFADIDELLFALYQERAGELAEQVATVLAGSLRDGTPSVPDVVHHVVDALMVDRDWIVVKSDFLLRAARDPRVATVLSAQQHALQEILADHLAVVVEFTALPAPLRSAAGLARAVATLHDGAMTRLLVGQDEQEVRHWLADLLVALLAPGDRPAG